MSAIIIIAIAAPAGSAESGRRLEDALQAPEWLSISGSYRLRFEYLDNTFRAVDPGKDRLLASRLLLHFQGTGKQFYGGFELQDSRAWLDDALTPIGTDDVNVTEPLRAYLGIQLADVLRPGDTFSLQFGRQTFDIGSRRLVARNNFRNTINAFTGVHVAWSHRDGVALRAFLTLPVNRLPDTLDRGRLQDNEFELDQERTDTVFWGVHVANVRLSRDLDSEWYLYGLREDDSPSFPTRNRDLLTAGFRLRGSAGSWDFEVESAYQTGESRASVLPGDNLPLDHRAWFAHVSAGRHFAGRLQPHLILRYDYASGDEAADDNRFERFDTLFGARSFEYGPSGIYGLLARSNILLPGASLKLRLSRDAAASFDYRAAWLASDRDFLTTAGIRDPLGNSGSFVGHQLDMRLRWSTFADSFILELGTAYLFKGEFLRNAPNAPPDADTIYAYLLANYSF